MLRQRIYKLGQNPKLSLKRFLIGLGLFACSAATIAYGYYIEPLVQIIGLILLLPALFFAGWGYLGIFANRFAQVIVAISPDEPTDGSDKTS
jgi:hypothetical protein